jgi:hypothetical protein
MNADANRVRALISGENQYDVTAWKDFTHYATITIAARTPAEAIEKARQGWEDGDPDWEPCDDGGQPVHYAHAEPNCDLSELSADEAENNAEWLALEAPCNTALIDAARAMLAALTAMNHVDHAEGYCICPACDGVLPPEHHSTSCNDARAAIAQAEAAGITGEES